MLEQCLDRKANMQMVPLRADDVPDTEADISELIASVDYRPQVQEGVANFVRWYKEYNGVAA